MNLDRMPANELRGFYRLVEGNEKLIATNLFPQKPRGYIAAIKVMSHYAIFKAVAKEMRDEGKAAAASIAERICEKLWKRLPEFARW